MLGSMRGGLRRDIAALVLSSIIALPSRPAEAQVVKGDAVVISVVTLGTLGGLTTSVAAIVFALDHRTFTDAWIVMSLFSTAVSGAMTTAIVVDGVRGGNPGAIFGAVFYAAITLWPGYWTVKTALSEVEPGGRLDAEVAPAVAVDPAGPDRRGPRTPTAAFALSF